MKHGGSKLEGGEGMRLGGSKLEGGGRNEAWREQAGWRGLE